jgi:hypothetical protein
MPAPSAHSVRNAEETRTLRPSRLHDYCVVHLNVQAVGLYDSTQNVCSFSRVIRVSHFSTMVVEFVSILVGCTCHICDSCYYSNTSTSGTCCLCCCCEDKHKDQRRKEVGRSVCPTVPLVYFLENSSFLGVQRKRDAAVVQCISLFGRISRMYC